MLVYRALRADELCAGGKDGGFSCPRASEAQCTRCGAIWDAEDVAGRCPSCKSSAARILRCEGCPVEEIARLRMRSAAGRLFDRILEIEFDSEHFQVPWSEVTAEEVKGLQILKSEREKYMAEQRKNAEAEQELRHRTRGRY